MFKLIKIFVIIMLACSCSIKPKFYADKKPVFDIRHYFNGELEAFGILQNRRGEVTRSITVKMVGSWEGN